MSNFKTQYGVYFVNDTRDIGYSNFYDTIDEANYWLHQMADDWDRRIEEQTYELEEDSHHDCSDDE